MTDDQVLQLIKTRVAADATASVRIAATRDAIGAAERAVGFGFPRFYVRLLTEVANGGFGPGYGLIGVPPDGYQDSDLDASLTDAYLRARDPATGVYRLPKGLLFLCNWGCGIFSYVDCLTESVRVITREALEDGPEYVETAPSLAGWLADWARGVDVEKEIYQVAGHREGLNPFTRKPYSYPIVRVKGVRVDLSDRI